mgnify:CR=1 FL=1
MHKSFQLRKVWNKGQGKHTSEIIWNDIYKLGKRLLQTEQKSTRFDFTVSLRIKYSTNGNSNKKDVDTCTGCYDSRNWRKDKDK